MKKKETKNNKLKIILMSIINPWTIVSIIVVLFCTICFMYETNKISNYEKINVTYVNDCSKYDICSNNYMYNVDGNNYGVSPAFETVEKYFKNNYAYYNKDNPSESIMISKWIYINIIFILIIVISSISYYLNLKK